MASAAVLESTPDDAGTKRTKNKAKPEVPKGTKTERTSTKGKKRNMSQKTEESACPRKMPKRSAACSDFKEKPVRLVDKSSLVETKKKQVVDEEAIAVRLTAGKEDGRACRRLTDFIFHDSEGLQRAFEMSEVDDIFISGLILPLDDSSEGEKKPSIRCEGFGRVETWAISGYEDGTPVIWVSTEIADYDCLKPSSCYKKFYDHFYAKACVCIEVYKKLSRSSGGNPDLSLDELLAGVVRAMSGSKCFSGGASIKEFIISQGPFIYNQLVGLDETCTNCDTLFAEMPVLAALRDVSRKHMDVSQAQEAYSKGRLTIGSKVCDGDQAQNISESSHGTGEEDEDVKLAKLLQEEEYWNSMKQKKSRGSVSSSKVYIKINEDEIANDYPLPSYYKTSTEETDEYVVVDNDMDVCDPEDLPRNMLHDWSLYNSDSRLSSLELLPMKPCADIDVTIFGSGVMTADDGTGFCLDSDPNQSSSSGSNTDDLSGIPIYLSAIKEWMIEFGSNMVFVSIRTDMSWYRLGKPSKQYAPWYEPVLKTAKLAISIITLLKEQSRVSRLSFGDVIKRVSEFEKDHPSFVSSNQTLVERYVVVHGQIILQQFSEYPDVKIQKCPFVIGLTRNMEERHHTKWVLKKKKVLMKNGQNLNPRAAMTPVSKRKVMQATTTRLINRIWGEYYSNYSPEEPQEEISSPVKDEEEVEEQDENEEDDAEDVTPLVSEKTLTPGPASRRTKSSAKSQEIKWVGDSLGQTSSGEPLYRKAIIHGDVIDVGTSVSVEAEETHSLSSIYFVEYMFETVDGTKMFHGRKMQRGSSTVLGNAANERELFLTNECMEFELGDVNEKVTADIRSMPWGYQHRKANAEYDKNDRARADERKRKGLQIEYYCKSLYYPEKGAFLSLPVKTMGLGSGICHACNEIKALSDKESFKVSTSKTSFAYKGTEYAVNDFIYVSPHHFSTEKVESGTFKGGRNVGLKAYVVCQLLEINVPKAPKQADPSSTEIKVRRFFRPEDISPEKSYCSDIREVYYSEEMHFLSTDTIEGRCEVRKRHDLPSRDVPALFEHIFFCECSYDPSKGTLKQLPSDIRLKYSTGKTDDDASTRKKKGKCKEKGDLVIQKQKEVTQDNRLTTLDIFAGCGGLSEGLQQSGVTNTKWAIEYEEPAGDAFRLNHPESFVFVNNCNVILRAVMDKCGDVGDCVSTPEAADLASSLGEKEKANLPMPGQVDFINGGPPCQGFSGMNRFNQGTWSKVQCEMILAFLSFADYFRPKFFLLENVRTFVSFNKGQTFRLTLASLLEMGYQVRFGILEAGTFGVPQSRKRAFIWAASPEEILPDWPEPMHVFAVPELKITLSGNVQYAAARSTAGGAPFRSITVRDTIGDLPPVANGASKTNLEYQSDPISWFQKQIRANMVVLSDHISKEMSELNLIRCKRIPKRPGADWQDLPDEKVKLSTGQMVDLIPWCLPNTAKRHNQWKGLFGRLDWEGNFPTSVTDPQPMGKVGMCFHPDQDRIVTVRECARSQGFPDSYQFSGNILHKHRQIGNAVPPPLAYALGRKLKEALEKKKRSQ